MMTEIIIEALTHYSAYVRTLGNTDRAIENLMYLSFRIENLMYFLKLNLKSKTREFSGGPVIRTQCFCC